MKSVAVGISYGAIGGSQGQQPYPSGPSQLSTLKSLGQLETKEALP
jgi:hypothetical protein